MLLEKCATFLAENMKTAEDVFKLMQLSKDTFPDADPNLLQLNRGIPASVPPALLCLV